MSAEPPVGLVAVDDVEELGLAISVGHGMRVGLWDHWDPWDSWDQWDVPLVPGVP
jgi:hypothetical protein